MRATGGGPNRLKPYSNLEESVISLLSLDTCTNPPGNEFGKPLEDEEMVEEYLVEAIGEGFDMNSSRTTTTETATTETATTETATTETATLPRIPKKHLLPLEEMISLKREKFEYNKVLQEKKLALREQELALREQELALREQELALREKEVALHEQQLRATTAFFS